MNSRANAPSARQYVENLAATGSHSFTSQEARHSLGVSADASKLALNRLSKRGLIASPARGFYVIVPPEYRSLGCLPADQFIPALMKRLDLRYYVGPALGRAIPRRGASAPAGTPGLPGQETPPDCLRNGACRVHGPQAYPGGAGPELQHAAGHGARIDAGGHGAGPRRIPTARWRSRLRSRRVLSDLAERIDPEKLAAAAGTGADRRGRSVLDTCWNMWAPANAPALKAYVRAHARESDGASAERGTHGHLAT